MNKKEAIFFIIVAILLIVGVAFSTVHVIDKKIGNVRINVPDVKVPRPDVTIRLQGTTAVDNDGHDVNVIDERRKIKMVKIKDEKDKDEKDKDDKDKDNSLDDVSELNTETESDESVPTYIKDGMNIKGHNNGEYM